jgi:hypothetical protein
MSDTEKNQARSETARQGVAQAEKGAPSGARILDQVRGADPATAEAVEQEAEDGPPGRGLSR